MDRNDKIAFIKGLAEGNRHIDELVNNDPQIDYEKCTSAQLEAVFVIGKRLGKVTFFLSDPGLTDEDRETLKDMPINQSGQWTGANGLPSFDHLEIKEIDSLINILKSE